MEAAGELQSFQNCPACHGLGMVLRESVPPEDPDPNLCPLSRSGGKVEISEIHLSHAAELERMIKKPAPRWELWGLSAPSLSP